MMKPKLDICVVAALGCVNALIGGCDRASKPTEPKTEWIDPNKLQPGPVLHASLTEGQLARVRRVQKVFGEVDPSPLEKWIEDFRRDVDPERELRIWEGMATAYETFTTSKNLTLAAKKEALQVVLLRSGAPDEEVLAHLKLKVLTEKEAREIMALFTTKPEPVGVISQ